MKFKEAFSFELGTFGVDNPKAKLAFRVRMMKAKKDPWRDVVIEEIDEWELVDFAKKIRNRLRELRVDRQKRDAYNLEIFDAGQS